MCSALTESQSEEIEYWSPQAEEEFQLASVKGGYSNYGLSPHFKGINFSDDLAALRDPVFRGRYSRGARSRGRGRGRYQSRGAFGAVNERSSKPENGHWPVDRGSTQCFKCKLYGHYARECREKPTDYLALARPFVKGQAEELSVTAAAIKPAPKKGKAKGKQVKSLEEDLN